MGANFFQTITIDEEVVNSLLNIKRLANIHEKSASEKNLQQYLSETSIDIDNTIKAIQEDQAAAQNSASSLNR